MRAKQTEVTTANLNQLRWRCRRGMRELDLLLVGHLERHVATLAGSRRAVFERLLACLDVDLYSWFTGRAQPADAELAALVATILREARPRREPGS